MSGAGGVGAVESPVKAFAETAAVKPAAPAKPKTRAFSIRFTDEERAKLEAEAGDRPLGAYIRWRLLEDKAAKRKYVRKPRADHVTMAMFLAGLGRSGIFTAMNDLAKAARIGVLEAPPETTARINEACTHIADMRTHLIEALGVKAR